MSRIRLTIDRVVLQGMDPAERNALVEGLRSELERMLADREGRPGGDGNANGNQGDCKRSPRGETKRGHA